MEADSFKLINSGTAGEAEGGYALRIYAFYIAALALGQHGESLAMQIKQNMDIWSKANHYRELQESDKSNHLPFMDDSLHDTVEAIKADYAQLVEDDKKNNSGKKLKILGEEKNYAMQDIIARWDIWKEQSDAAIIKDTNDKEDYKVGCAACGATFPPDPKNCPKCGHRRSGDSPF